MVNQIAFNLVFNKIVPTHQIEKIVSNLNWTIHLYNEYFFTISCFVILVTLNFIDSSLHNSK